MSDLNCRALHHEGILLVDCCPDGANIRVSPQNRHKVSFGGSFLIDLADEPIQPETNLGSCVFHSFRVLQDPETLVCILLGSASAF